jgi:hypothetical protein
VTRFPANADKPGKIDASAAKPLNITGLHGFNVAPAGKLVSLPRGLAGNWQGNRSAGLDLADCDNIISLLY